MCRNIYIYDQINGILHFMHITFYSNAVWNVHTKIILRPWKDILFILKRPFSI